jgi:outer membrane protein
MRPAIMTLSLSHLMSSVSVRGVVHSAEARFGRYGAALLLALLTLALCAGNAAAQQAARPGGTVTLSLDDALRIAQQQSQAIDIAKAGVSRATGQRLQARSQAFPQLNASAGYGRTLQSQFSGFAAAASTDTTPKPAASQSLCTPFVSATATAAERQAALAQATTCPSSSGGGFDLSKTSFGAKNQYQLAINFSQTVYSGGRIQAQTAAADAQIRSADIDVSAQRAQTSLDVTSAYYDAVLTDQLRSIADSALAQTEVVLQQTRVARQVGNASEYDLLRAQVTRDNQLPQRIQARANQQNAYLRLKQLLNMPLDDSLRLTTRIEEPSGPTLPAIATDAKPDTSARDRAPVRQLDEAIHAQEQQIKIAKSQRIPSLAVVSNYQRLYFPINTFPTLNAGVNNWTLGLSTSFPVLDGGRIKGDVAVAEAGLAQARANREQARQFAALDSRVALTALQEAEASWEASRGTAEQAQRTYAIDEVRFREGISTQTDLSQSRLLLEQARANRAMAARNLAVARVRLALLRDLPLQTSAGAAGQAAQQQQQLQQAQQQLNSSNPAARGGSTGGIQP